MSDTFSSQEWYRVADAKLRLRRDIEVRRHIYLGRPWHVLTDATGGKVHRLTPAAFAIVGRMDGTVSVSDIWQSVQREHGADTPSQDEVIKLLTQLHNGDLLAGADRPLLDDLLERRDKENRQSLKKLLLNPLSVTVPLIDPNRFLGKLVQVMGVLPRWFWWGLVSAAILPAAFMLPLHWGALTDRGLEGFLDLENLLLVAFIYPIVKVIHEIGHGVTTRSRGGEVHEMGLMFIAFYPIPYVEASASLAFPSKWERAAVAGAGVVVELVIAAVAFYVWVGAEPGLGRTIAYNTMLISGLSTLVVNGNPLLRFDGYHVMCDVVEIPNLGKRGNNWWGEFARVHVLGTQERDRMPLLKWERFWFIIYPPAAFAYRVFISLTIALFVATTYRAAGIVLAIWSLVLSLVWPILKTAHKAVTDQRIKAAGSRALIGGASIAVLLLGLLFLLPLPHRVSTEGVVWLPRDAIIRAKGSGVVEMVSARHGQDVIAGDLLMKMSAPERHMAVEQTQARISRLEAEYSASLVDDRSAAVGLQEALKDARRSRDDAVARIDDLTLKADLDGTLDLPNAEDMAGRFLREGEAVGYILPDGQRVVRVMVRQDSIGLVRGELQSISLRFAYDLKTIHHGRIKREVPAGAAQLPSAVFSLDGGGTFATLPTGDGDLRIVGRAFQFDVELIDPPGELPPFGMRAHILFDFQPKPAGFQLSRSLRSLFLSAFDA